MEKIDRFCEDCQEIAAEYCAFGEWPVCDHKQTESHPKQKVTVHICSTYNGYCNSGHTSSAAGVARNPKQEGGEPDTNDPTQFPADGYDAHGL